ncbi:hypothetical protein EON65_19460 [archaeon]|nr:MAG: hypothetical protein EON65_19460 [archaeon]
MGNAATIVNRSIFTARNTNKDFQAVVPFPPNQPPPSSDRHSRKSSRKQKALASSNVAPAPAFEDLSKNTSPLKSTRPHSIPFTISLSRLLHSLHHSSVASK